MLKRYNILNQKFEETNGENSHISVYITPDQQELDHISEKYNIDKHTLDSAQDPDEVSRIEFEDEGISIIWKRPKNYLSTDNLLFGVSSMGLFLLNDELVVVMPEDIDLFDSKNQLHKGNLMDVVCAFMAILEAVKFRMASIWQNRMFGDIKIKPWEKVAVDEIEITVEG